MMVRKKRAIDKKREQSLKPEDLKQLQKIRAKKERGLFLMPDAPPKRSRKTSPERGPCVLAEGTPSVPPPRVPRPWEIEPVSSELIGFSPLARSLQHSESSMHLPQPSTQGETFRQSPSLQRSASPNLFDDDVDSDQWVPRAEGSDNDDDGDQNAVADRLEFFKDDVEAQLLELDAAEDDAIRNVASSFDEDMTIFNWVEDFSAFTGTKESFTGTAGPTFPVNGETPLSVLQRIFDVATMQTIVDQTNIYARQIRHQLVTPRGKSRIEKWVDTTIDEMWVFFSILVLQGLVILPVELEYWYPKLDVVKMQNFPKIMPYARFVMIKKCLHFVDNTQIAGTSRDDKRLAKIKPLVDLLKGKFSSMFLPGQEIALDESLLLWKGKLSFAQLIANKRAKVGIKTYELCDSKTGYLWDLRIYAGKGHISSEPQNEPEDEPQGATAKIVFDLVRPLLGQGHVLVMDNFYNSPLLSRLLKRQQTDTMGTLRLNRDFIPNSLKMSKTQMRPGEVAYSQTTDLSIVVWRDVNVVSMISTYHKVEISGIEKFGKFRYKPKVVLDYNLAMGGVDKKDQLLSAFPMERCRNLVWYKKLFRRMLNVSIMNSWVIFCTENPTMKARTYRQTLVEEILAKHKTGWGPRSNVTIASNSNRRTLLQGGHYPEKCGSHYRRCKWCSMHNRTSRTSVRCDVCDVALCIEGCFKDYHTKPN